MNCRSEMKFCWGKCLGNDGQDQNKDTNYICDSCAFDNKPEVFVKEHGAETHVMQHASTWIFYQHIPWVLLFHDGKRELIVITVDGQSQSYGRNTNATQFYQATINDVIRTPGFLHPVFIFHTHMKIPHKMAMLEENPRSWYQFAKLAVGDERFRDRINKKRKPINNDRKNLANSIREEVVKDGEYYLLLSFFLSYMF